MTRTPTLRSWAAGLVRERVAKDDAPVRSARSVTGHSKRRRMPDRPNPWGLTPYQVFVMESMIANDGENGTTARTLRLSPKTTSTHMTRIIEKMGVRTKIAAILTFDRWNREQNTCSS